MTAQETDQAEGLPPHRFPAHHPGGGHRRPRSRDGRTLSSALFTAACTAFGLAVATAVSVAVPSSVRTAVFLAVQVGATLLGALLGLLRRPRPATKDAPSAVHWSAAGGHQGTTVNGGGAIPGAG
ncbi:hypothetical protein ABZZ74_51915 [Streptomyces sp. NPDC006476]|uniref:hypothetical protein n=1 Tax=Streptomyces sp. NPDC006476 TaxID=3157175 RepID=UPI0033A8E7C0